jgi:hypothetical protein
MMRRARSYGTPLSTAEERDRDRDDGGGFLLDADISTNPRMPRAISVESLTLLPALVASDQDLKLPPMSPPRQIPPISGTLVFWAHCVPALVIVAAGLAGNGGHKYIRLRDEGGECASLWADAYGEEGATTCCPRGDLLLLGMCRAAMLKWTTVYMGKLWVALFIPVIGFIINTSGQTPSRVTTPREKVKEKHRHRLALYVFIILWRYFMLYRLPKLLWWHEKVGTDCWYAMLTYRGTCRTYFDFSDHVVLFIGQYLAIQMFETFATLRESRIRWHKTLSVIVATLVSMAALGGTFDTVAFFHTREESAGGFVVALVGVFLPLWVIMTGKAAEFRWLNPHYYIAVEGGAGEEEQALEDQATVRSYRRRKSGSSIRQYHHGRSATFGASISPVRNTIEKNDTLWR